MYKMFKKCTDGKVCAKIYNFYKTFLFLCLSFVQICIRTNIYVSCKNDTYKSFLQDGDILVVVLIAVDAVDNASGHVLPVQL